VYVVHAVRPLSVRDVTGATTDVVGPPTRVTSYAVADVTELHVTVRDVAVFVAFVKIGALATVQPVVVHGAPSPAAFAGVTVTLYWMPLRRPVTGVLVDDAGSVTVDQTADAAGFQATTLRINALPPFDPWVHEIVKPEVLGEATVAPAHTGVVYGVTPMTEAFDHGESPARFVARARKKYAVPFASPGTLKVVDVDVPFSTNVPVPAANPATVEYSMS
jgi:hypothetical protein